MNHFIRLLYLFSFVVMLFSCSQEELTITSDTTYDDLLDEYLRVSGQQMQDNPLLDDIYDMPIFTDEDSNRDYKDMMDTMMMEMEVMFKQVYNEELDAKDLRELIVFYKSPLGRKLVDVNRKMSKASFKFGTETTTKRIDEMFERDTKMDPELNNR